MPVYASDVGFQKLSCCIDRTPDINLVSVNDADLTLQSSEKVLFKVHRVNLSTHSCIFPGSEIPVSDEIVPFPEKAKILELLLQHIYPDTTPDMDGLEFPVLLLLADAAEKYHIFNLMEICRLHMK